MAVIGSRQTDVEEFGYNALVVTDPKARLMYYVDSIYSVLDLTSIRNIEKLRKYKNHQRLTEAETRDFMSSDDTLCRRDDNKFYKINTTEHNLIVSDALIIERKMAVIGSRQTDVEEFGYNALVSTDPKARLMYYVDSIYSVLDLTSIRNIEKLRKYKNHQRLTEAETRELYELCKILSPDILDNKVIFQDDTLCRRDDNKFYKINTTEHNLIVSDALIIGGKRCSVKKIMAYKIPWIQWIYIGPMEHFKQQYPSEWCNIM